MVIIKEAMKTRKFNKSDVLKHPILYHYTRKEFAKNILKHDYFRTSPGTIGIMGLSTTFNKNYKWGAAEVCFELDSKKLFEDYKLIFVNEQLSTKNGKLNEYEVKVLCDKAILNASKYIIKVEYQ